MSFAAFRTAVYLILLVVGISKLTAADRPNAAIFAMQISRGVAQDAAVGADVRTLPTNFNRDIAPILYAHCATCHRPGEVAPFPLLTFDDARTRGLQIAEIVRKRFMPPWKPVRGHGEFLGARQLSDEEIGLFAKWVEHGLEEGDPSDRPPLPEFTDGWQLGEPDLVLTMEEPFEVPADGPDVYRNFVMPLELPPGKFIRAAEYRASNRPVVHHAALSIDESGSRARKLDEADPGIGYTDINLPGRLFPGSMAAWTPGREAIGLPDGFSMPWPQDADLVLQLHLSPTGKPEKEQSSIGIYLTDEPPERSMLDLLLIDRNIDIPPGESDYRTHDSFTLPIDAEAFGIFPHMHLIGKDIRVTAKLPYGEETSLLWINDWDFNWQNYYQYAAPVPLPKGTQVTMECVHDNSAANPKNPNDPPKQVKWGFQTSNEMSAAVLQIVPSQESDVKTLLADERLKGRVLGKIVAQAPQARAGQ